MPPPVVGGRPRRPAGAGGPSHESATRGPPLSAGSADHLMGDTPTRTMWGAALQGGRARRRLGPRQSPLYCLYLAIFFVIILGTKEVNIQLTRKRGQ